jgi:hypothetical protein
VYAVDGFGPVRVDYSELVDGYYVVQFSSAPLAPAFKTSS